MTNDQNLERDICCSFRTSNKSSTPWNYGRLAGRVSHEAKPFGNALLARRSWAVPLRDVSRTCWRSAKGDGLWAQHALSIVIRKRNQRIKTRTVFSGSGPPGPTPIAYRLSPLI